MSSTQESGEMAMGAAEAAAAMPSGKLSEKLSGMDKYKDKTYQNEEEAVSDAIALIDEMDASSKEAAEFKENFMKVIEENPVLAFILKDIKETGSIQASLQSLFDSPEDMLLREGDEGYDTVQEKVKKRAEQDKANDDISQKWEQNQVENQKVFADFVEKKGIDEAEQDSFADFIGNFAVKIIMGEIKDEELSKLWDAYKYNDDVSALEEDLGISKANETPAQKRQAPILPMPAAATPAQKTTPETPERIDPLTEIYNAKKLKS